MALRTGHGTGKGVPRVEVLPVDELPDGVPADARPELPSDRGEAGRFAPGNTLAATGGKARSGQCRLAHRLHLGDSFTDPRFAPYARSAKVWRTAQLGQLAATVGGGFVGPGPSSVVASAALQLAASRFAFEVLGDLVLGSRLANDSRQNLLAAHELCAREAASRPKPNAFDWLTAPAPTLPTPKGTSEPARLAESNVVPTIDKVDGPRGDQ
jgi:hypothetical protein